MAKRPHDILGVPASATASQVRKAYKRLAREVHPDRDPSPNAARRFMEIKAAHDEMLRLIRAGGYPEDPPRRPPPKKKPRPRPAARGPGAAPPRRPPPRAHGKARTDGNPWVIFEDGPIPPPSWATDEALRSGLAEAIQQSAARVKPRDMWTPTLWIAGLLTWFLFFGLFLESIRQFDTLMNPSPPPQEDAPPVEGDAGAVR